MSERTQKLKDSLVIKTTGVVRADEKVQMTDTEEKNFFKITGETVKFLRKRYNKANRWVVADVVKRHAARTPNKPALIFPHMNMQLTYSQLEEECNRFANALLNLGLNKYDRVAFLTHNSIHWVIAWVGILKTGCIAVPLNYLLLGKDLSYQIDNAESKVLLVEDTLYPVVKDIMGEIPTVKTYIWSNQGKGEKAPDGWLDFDELRKKYPSAEPDVELHIEEPIEILYTAGTESLPKGAILTNQNWLAETMSASYGFELRLDDIHAVAMPLFHSGGHGGTFGPALALGLTQVIIFVPTPIAIMETVQNHKGTWLFLGPSVWIGLINHPDFGKYDLSSLRTCTYGGSTMPVEVMKEVAAKLPGFERWVCAYGQTELTPCHCHLPSQYTLEKPASTGPSGLNLEHRLERDDHTVIDETHVPGEICARGGHVFMGYYKRPKETEEAMAHGWFHSGDIGIHDELNFITIVDRKKDVIVTGAENVSSREIEEFLYTDPRVLEAIVVGLPHEKWGEAVTAIIVPKEGAQIAEEEVITLCKQNLAGFKVPKKVIFIKQEEIPRAIDYKVRKVALREKYKDQ